MSAPQTNALCFVCFCVPHVCVCVLYSNGRKKKNKARGIRESAEGRTSVRVQEKEKRTPPEQKGKVPCMRDHTSATDTTRTHTEKRQEHHAPTQPPPRTPLRTATKKQQQRKRRKERETPCARGAGNGNKDYWGRRAPPGQTGAETERTRKQTNATSATETWLELPSLLRFFFVSRLSMFFSCCAPSGHRPVRFPFLLPFLFLFRVCSCVFMHRMCVWSVCVCVCVLRFWLCSFPQFPFASCSFLFQTVFRLIFSPSFPFPPGSRQPIRKEKTTTRCCLCVKRKSNMCFRTLRQKGGGAACTRGSGDGGGTL